MATLQTFVEANAFAFKAHYGQLRQGDLKLPYICHPLEVTNLLARAGYAENHAVLAAAMLHDVVEDCDVKPADLSFLGPDVVALVNELTFINLTKAEKIARAPLMTKEACAIKTADLISNLYGIAEDPTAMTKANAARYAAYARGMFDAFTFHNAYLDDFFEAALIVLFANI